MINAKTRIHNEETGRFEDREFRKMEAVEFICSIAVQTAELEAGVFNLHALEIVQKAGQELTAMVEKMMYSEA